MIVVEKRKKECDSRGERYEVDAERSFENLIKRISAIREALTARNQKEADIMSAKIGD